MIEAQGLDPSRFPALSETTMHCTGTATPRACSARRVRSARWSPINRAPRSPRAAFETGQGKVTYGTSATLDVNTGLELKIAPGSYPMVLWKRDGVRSFCIEGMVNTAGAMIDWAVGELGLAASAAELSHLAATVPDSAGAFVLPALQGLGTPHGDTTRHAAIGGLTARDDPRPRRPRGARRHRVPRARSTRRRFAPCRTCRCRHAARRRRRFTQRCVDADPGRRTRRRGRAARSSGSDRARCGDLRRGRARASGRPITARRCGAWIARSTHASLPTKQRGASPNGVSTAK